MRDEIFCLLFFIFYFLFFISIFYFFVVGLLQPWRWRLDFIFSKAEIS